MSDHSRIRYLFEQPNMISEFEFEIKYIKGKENKVVDALSRRM